MARHLKKISISFTLSCLLLDFGYGSTPCQNGYNYDNRCDPYYNINLIQAKVNNDKNRVTRRVEPPIIPNVKSEDKVLLSKSSTSRQSNLSYLDTLRRKYSSQFNGRMGLQALIDRSKYLSLKKIDNIDNTKSNKKEEPKIVQNKIKEIPTNNKKTPKLAEKKHKATTINKNISNKKVVNTTKKIKVKVVKKSIKSIKNSYYTVKAGDNLIKIANKFSLSKKRIVALNKLDKNATIKIGQKLLLPKIVKALIAKRKIKKSIKQSNKKIYIVKRGDTLLSIAKKKNISLITLREINKLSRSGNIKIGQKLLLNSSNTIKKKLAKYDIVKNTKFRKSLSLKYKRKIRVVATAYTSHRNQTDKTPFLAAWNNHLKPGMKIIAVSPDLIKKYGLTNGVKVKILGLKGYYVVRDKMNARLRNHIDIYMGVNKRRALQWGRKRIVLYW